MKRSVLVGILISVLVLGLVVLAGCSSPSTTPTPSTTTDAGGATVTIENFAFTPSSVEVKVGDSVTWTNKDTPPHTVTGDGGIASDTLATGASYTQKFDTAGTFNYKCSIHPTMAGTVVVK